MDVSIRDITMAVKSILDGHRGQMTAALTEAGFDQPMGQILDYWTDAVDQGMYPLIMLQHESESSEWVALPDIVEETYSLSIWGLVRHDDPRISAEMIGQLSKAVKSALNRNHQPIPIREGYEIYFNDRRPIKSISYGITQVGTTIAKGFVAQFSSNVQLQQTDERRL